jgi:hypothetical protein
VVYELDCGAFAAFPEDSRSPGTLHVREEATPAAPPEALGELDAREAEPESHSCGPTGLAPCETAGYIALSIDFSAQYFTEGAPDPDAGSGCRMGAGGVAPALWLLGPLTWTFTRRRRE